MNTKDKNSEKVELSTNIHSGHRKRLRNKLASNEWSNMEEHELLEYLLTCAQPRKDTNPLAHKLINTFGSFANVLDASMDKLMKIEGVGEAIATFLVGIPNLFKYYKLSKFKKGADCATAKQVFDKFAYALTHLENEEFYLICVDKATKLIASKLISRGTHKEVSVAIKDISEFMFKVNAKGIILVHNHPNGNCVASHEDVELTKKIYITTKMNNVELVDHLIVGNNLESEYYSFKHSGMFTLIEQSTQDLFGKTKANSSTLKYDASKL